MIDIRRRRITGGGLAAAGLLGAGVAFRPRQAQATTPMEIALALQAQDAFGHTALAATDRLLIEDGVRIVSPVGTGVTVSNFGVGLTRLGVQAETGNVFSRGPVELRDRARSTGNIISESGVQIMCPPENLEVAGSITEFAAEPILRATPAWVIDFPTGGSNVNSGHNQTLALEPGAYRQLVVESSSALELKSGIYYFRKLELRPNARVRQHKENGPIYLYVRDQLTWYGEWQTISGAAEDTLAVYLGQQPVVLEKALTGTFVAPWSHVTLTSNFAHEGSLFARQITVRPWTTVTLRPFTWSHLAASLPCD